jgi:hypothetical protein
VGTVHSSNCSSSISDSNKNSRKDLDGNQTLATGLLASHCTKLFVFDYNVVVVDDDDDDDDDNNNNNNNNNKLSAMTILCLTRNAVRVMSTDQSGLPYVRFYPEISSC